MLIEVLEASRQRLGFLLKKGLVKRPEEWRWSSYNNFALEKPTVPACPVQIDYVRLPPGYRAWEKTTVRKALTVATCYSPGDWKRVAQRGGAARKL